MYILFNQSCFTFHPGTTSNREVVIKTSQLSVGNYDLTCTVDGTTEKKGFMVYSAGTLSVNQVIPERIPINTAYNITLKGFGFTDTGKKEFFIIMYHYKNINITTVSQDHHKINEIHIPSSFNASPKSSL